MGFCVCAFSSFATLENSGLLFYNGRFNEKHDFIALEIQEGQVVLKYSTGTIFISLCVIQLQYCIFYIQYFGQSVVAIPLLLHHNDRFQQKQT